MQRQGTLRDVYAAGRPWDVLRTSINYVFMRFFIFLIPFLCQTFYCKSKLKTWYLLFWYYYGPGRCVPARRLLSSFSCVINIIQFLSVSYKIWKQKGFAFKQIWLKLETKNSASFHMISENTVELTQTS